MQRYIFITLFGAAGVLTGQLPACAQTYFTYHCRDGSEFVAAFFEGDRRAHLQLDGKAVTLPKRVSMLGSRYAKGGTTLRIKNAKGEVVNNSFVLRGYVRHWLGQVWGEFDRVKLLDLVSPKLERNLRQVAG